MIKKRKLVIIVLLLMIATTYNVKYVQAGGGFFDGDGGDTTNPSNPYGEGNECKNMTTTHKILGCGIGTSINYESSVYIDIYDTDETYLGTPISTSFLNKTFKAGMFVGINVYEKYKKIGKVTINPFCIQVTVTCTKVIPGDCGQPYCHGEKTESGACKPYTSYYPDCAPDKTITYTASEGSGCGEDETLSGVSCSGCDPPSVSSCRAEAESKLAGLNVDSAKPSYIAKRKDVNDITNENLTVVPSYEEKLDTGIQPADVNSPYIERTVIKYFKYNTQQACINVKTGIIRYIKFEENCNQETELSVENIKVYNNETGRNEKIGMYFIPLNTKSNNAYQYILEANGNQKHEADLPTTSVDEGKTRVENGCYYATTVNFKVVQKFYNQTATNRLEGYGFFYRPIDVTNPFPNGLGSSTYWGDGEKYNRTTNIAGSGSKTYKLSDSYNNSEITYIVDVGNPNAIREYNSIEDGNGESYMSWHGMNKSGRSDFVSNYVQRIASESFYRLGCGPSNATWEECK